MLVVGLMLAGVMAACGDATATTVPAATTAAATAAATTAKPSVAATTAAVATTASGTTAAATSAVATTAAPVATTAAATSAVATTAAPVATTAAVTGPVTKGGTFRYRQASEPKTLDPGFMTDNVSINIAQNMFEGLLELDQNLQVKPQLAEALPTVSPDGLTYTFKLRKGLNFSNGDPLTAKDFLYSWNRVLQLGDAAEYASVLYEIDGAEAISGEKDDAKRKVATASGIKAVDDYTIEVKLTKPAAYFLTEISLWTFWPVNQKLVESKGDKFDDKNPWSTEAANLAGASTGPFIMKDWKHDVSMRLEANPNYKGPGPLPNLDAVTVDIIKEDATAKLKFDNNELDDTIVPTADIQKTKRDAKYKDTYKEFAQARITYVGINFSKDNVFSKNLKLRQAVAYAIDRQVITEGALQGAALPATILIPEGLPGYKVNNTLDFNKAKAAQTFKDAGYDTPDKVKALADTINNYGDGKSGGIAFNADASANVAWATSLQQQLKDNLGLDIKLNPVATFKEFLKRRTTDKEFLGLYRASWGADYPDPQNFYAFLFNSNSGNNQSFYKNPKYDDLVKKGDAGSTPAQRAEFYQQAEQVLQDDAAYVPLFVGIETRLLRPSLQGYSYTAQGPYRWKFMSIKK